jgi:hypothetical protein
LAQAPTAHHWHGITATAWLLLMATQSVTIHRGQRHWHRRLGWLLLVLVPLMSAAFALVTWQGAIKAVNQHPFYVLFGEALLTADVLLLFTTSLQVYLALKFRRQVHLHSALMLSTVMGLLPPVLSRLFANWVPGLLITGPDTLYLFEYCLQLSMLVSLLLAVWLYLKHQAHGWPWILAAMLVILMYVLYATLGQTLVWQRVVAQLATWSMAWVFATGWVVGLLACVLGWYQGKRR